MRGHAASFGDFRCAHCNAIVSSAHMLSGVNNRNHCPYCLVVLPSGSVRRGRPPIRMQGADETHRADHEEEQEQVPA